MELEKLKEIISQVLSVDANEITEETRITEDLGADSLDLYQIVLSIEQEFNISNSSSFGFVLRNNERTQTE